jgi:anti-anti-sigma regulatory factor
MTKDGNMLHLALAGELGVSSAQAIYDELSSHLDEETSLVVDATQVSRIDTSILQLVYYASKRARDFHVAARSSAFAESWGALGLEDMQATDR